MITKHVRLSLRDRYRLVKRVVKLALDKDSNYVNLLWKKPEGGVLTHTFYAKGTDPLEPFLAYMATVAGHSKTLEAMNERAQFYLDKTTIAFTHFNGLDLDDYAYVANPIRNKPSNPVNSKWPIKRLFEDNVTMTSKFSGAVHVLCYDEDEDLISMYCDDILQDKYDPTAEATYMGDGVWEFANIIFHVTNTENYVP